jgi:hypothetical protein
MKYVLMKLNRWHMMTGHMDRAYVRKNGEHILVGGPYEGPLRGPDKSTGCLLVFDSLEDLRKADKDGGYVCVEEISDVSSIEHA